MSNSPHVLDKGNLVGISRAGLVGVYLFKPHKKTSYSPPVLHEEDPVGVGRVGSVGAYLLKPHTCLGLPMTDSFLDFLTVAWAYNRTLIKKI